MDGSLNRPARSSLAPAAITSGLPPEASADMPSQTLASFDAGTRRTPRHQPSRPRAAGRRLLVLGGAALVAALLIDEMRKVLNVDGMTVLELFVLLLFALNMLWIAVPAVTSLVGLGRLLARRTRPRAAPPAPLATRTAIVVPLFNEEPDRVAASVDAMASGLRALGEAAAFDVYLLSDTNLGDLALAEQEMVWALRERFGQAPAVYYRRRARNSAHKSGNLRDFCQRWGSSYDHLLVLDADSLMEPSTIVELARRMERDPDAGLIQTVPRLVGGRTLTARTQQFASRVYGPPLAAGLAWWAGSEGNYWGHNAILRTQAFMTAAGLPELPGKPPWGGPILSHDFVEAALLRRAGWTVRIADDLAGSYETCPANLVDLSLRDRRWCQGNLQHARLLFGKGLHWLSRLHLAYGMMSFLSSPLWLLFLLSALALGVQNEFAKPEYFSRGYTLFPLWPHLDPVRALRLFFLTLAILFLPKVLGLLWFAAHQRRLAAVGGPLLLVSTAFEVLVSALVAPILMLLHSGFVASILAGRDGGWRPQRRGDHGVPAAQVAYRHRFHVIVGLLLGLAGLSVSWEMLAWLAPAVLGMVAAIPLVLLTGSPAVGRWVERRWLLRTPEEADAPGVWRAMHAALPFYRRIKDDTPDLAAVVSDPERLRRHLGLTDPAPPRAHDPIRPTEAVADLKVRAARTLDDAVERLTQREQAYVACAPDLLFRLARLPRRSHASTETLADTALERLGTR